MSLVTEYVEERQNELESERHNREGMRRVTVRLPGDAVVMLAEVAAALDKTNTGCAEELLKAAITEAWMALGPKTMEDIQRTLQGLVQGPSAKGKQGRSRAKDKPE
jgi:hypothetical protein